MQTTLFEDPVDLATTLDAVVVHLTRFVHFARPEHADAVALWAAHSHAPLELLEQSPLLVVTSAVKQAGKTRLFDVLAHLVRDPWRATRPTEATLFRKIERDHPTLLLDEIDTVFGDRAGSTEGIRAVFNSGNRRGTRVPRLVPKGNGFELAEFDVFCPKATAGIGGLPDTMLDRAIVIPMERRTPEERTERLRERRAADLGAPLREAIAGAVGSLGGFWLADEALPQELDDRAQDGWEPLLAIADAAGGDWPGRARRAAVAIFQSRTPADDNLGLALLADCRTVFDEGHQAVLASAQLRSGLIGLDSSQWADIRGKPISPHYIARLLAGFEIHRLRSRIAGKGNPISVYARRSLEDAWRRYLPPMSDTSGTTDTTHGRGPRSVPDVPLVPVPLGSAETHGTTDQPAPPWVDEPELDDWVWGTA